jgi:uncharacterized repeat protein (TIGR01451 family)
MRLTLVLLAMSVGLWSCDFATDVSLLEIAGTGVLFGQAYLDVNGSGVADVGDLPIKNASVVLTTAGSGDVVLSATTDTLGAFVLLAVPVGTYSLGLDSAVLSDTLFALPGAASVTVELGDTTSLSIGASYPTLTLQEVRGAAPGRRVFTRGVAMNQRTPGTDGTVHVLDTASVTYLRTTGVSVPAGDIQTGDSLRLLGRTASDNGQPVLTAVTPFVLQRGLSLPPPVEVTTGVARTANAGVLDAALARIRLAEISDTSTAPNGDFHFWAHNGADSVEVVFKWFRGISSAGVRPDTVVRINQASGLLTPFDDGTGMVRWRLFPRAASDVTLEIKAVDLAVTTAFDSAQASAGSTVQITVAVQSLVPASTHTARGVSITDAIPARLTFQSATATRGSYASGTGVWTIGDFAPGRADTLRITAQVTGTPGVTTNTATLNPLVSEAEVNTGNNSQSANLTVN